MLELDELVFAVESQQPELGDGLEDVLVGCVLELCDGEGKRCEDGEIAVGKGDFSAQEDLGVVPDVHDGQLLLLELQHVHAGVFDLAQQLVLQELNAFLNVSQGVSVAFDEVGRRLSEVLCTF